VGQIKIIIREDGVVQATGRVRTKTGMGFASAKKELDRNVENPLATAVEEAIAALLEQAEVVRDVAGKAGTGG
jgi:hypothetical protein